MAKEEEDFALLLLAEQEATIPKTKKWNIPTNSVHEDLKILLSLD